MVPVLRDAGGDDLVARLLDMAGIQALPSDAGLMAEGPAARLHQALRRDRPADAAQLAAQAGARTADYILAHRIPRVAQTVLRLLPRSAALPILSRAIARHAWTFAGSGQFTLIGPGLFQIAANPIVAGESAHRPLCHWHAAVFERLFRVLVDDRLRATEIACCACGDPACRFHVALPKVAARQGRRNVST
jgi:divinyl protochlorophyllide a 8-vinyl-reductase